MSHKVRTPLHGIIGFTNLLFQEKNPEVANKYKKQIKESGENLLQILSDVLDFEPMAETKGLELNVNFERNDSSIVEIDGERFQNNSY